MIEPWFMFDIKDNKCKICTKIVYLVIRVTLAEMSQRVAMKLIN